MLIIKEFPYVAVYFFFFLMKNMLTPPKLSYCNAVFHFRLMFDTATLILLQPDEGCQQVGDTLHLSQYSQSYRLKRCVTEVSDMFVCASYDYTRLWFTFE